jgi:hypothetical protein
MVLERIEEWMVGFAKNGPFFHLGSSKNGGAAQDFNPPPKVRVP